MARRTRLILGMSSLAVTALLLSGCAPEDAPPSEQTGLEPGTIGDLSSPPSPSNGEGGGAPTSPSPEKTPPPSFEGENGELQPDVSGRQPIDSPKQTELPSSFPTDHFQIPTSAHIFDAGERSATAWFVIILASDFDEATEYFDVVIDGSEGLVVEQFETSDDGSFSAVATSPMARVDALSLQTTDGTLLNLEFEISR